MASASGRYIIVFNGEIYNFRELRAQLDRSAQPTAWRGHSDTEVLLASVDEVGVEGSLRRLTGMFAFALWDKAERVLWLARDRLGKKPLYYSLTRKGLVFASELKALLHVVRAELTIAMDALNTYLRLGYVPGGSTIYKQCSKLPAGHFLRIEVDGLAKLDVLPSPTCYWSLEEVAIAGQQQSRAGRFATQEEFETLLDDAVAKRMVADVGLGAFLSGGLDSSLVVARMAALSPRPPRTFSIAFEESRWNEAPYARAIAAALETEHTEFTVTPQDTRDVIPHLAATFDEPFADASMIPTLVVCRMARQHVTVALSGDGGDEFFGGYDRYNMASKADRWASVIPSVARPAGASLLRLTLSLADVLDVNARTMRRLRAITKALCAKPGKALFQDILTITAEPARLTGNAGEISSPETADAAWLDPLDLRRQCMLVDARGFLTDDVLVKVDRTSMSTSLEVRAPLLDHRIVELAWRMRTEDLYDGERGKMPFRRALGKQLPTHLYERPKMGFGVPVQEWLRGPLLDWAEALLDPARLRREGHFHEPAVTTMWRHYLRHRGGWTHTIWCILMFQAWLESLER
jgi:asparagine synthase (glutamine-hydrolysing)